MGVPWHDVLVDVSDIFYVFLLGGGEWGVRGARRRGARFLIENSRRGGWFSQEKGGGGTEGPRGCLQVIGGGGLNIFIRGRNSHPHVFSQPAGATCILAVKKKTKTWPNPFGTEPIELLSKTQATSSQTQARFYPLLNDQGPLGGGVSNGGFPIWTRPSTGLSFIVRFGTSPIFLDFSDLSGDFPDFPFSSFLAYQQHLRGTVSKRSATQSGAFPNKVRNPRFGNPLA